MFDNLYYEAVFEHLLKNRHATELRVNSTLQTVKSEDDLNIIATEITVRRSVADVYKEIETNILRKTSTT